MNVVDGLFGLEGEFQRVTCMIRFGMGLVDAFLCFSLGQGLDIRRTIDMRREHDLSRLGIGQVKARLEDVDDEVHWREVIVMNHDLEQRFKVGFGLFDELYFRGGTRVGHTVRNWMLLAFGQRPG